MPWGKLDDSLYDHPKVERLPDGIRLACVGLWTLSNSYSNRHLTDGQIPAATIRRLGGTKRLVDALVEVGLYEQRDDGVVVHDFLDHNKSRVQVLEERDKRAESGRLGGLARGKQLGKHAASKLLSKNEAAGAKPPSRPVPSPSSSQGFTAEPSLESDEPQLGDWPSPVLAVDHR